LPPHGRVACARCFGHASVEFDQTRREDAGWRITNNPLAWGSTDAEVVVLGFSKGPTQAGALQSTPHDAIAYKGSRLNVGRILARVGLLAAGSDADLRAAVDRAIADRAGRFHFGSLIRCTVERFDPAAGVWKGTGGSMLDGFMASLFGGSVAGACTSSFLADPGPRTKLVVMFGLGTRLNYVSAARRLFEANLPGAWRPVNDVAYSNGELTVVHVEHFASQGALIPKWLGVVQDPRMHLSRMAAEAVAGALAA
jgi:hypothetical protein